MLLSPPVSIVKNDNKLEGGFNHPKPLTIPPIITHEHQHLPPNIINPTAEYGR